MSEALIRLEQVGVTFGGEAVLDSIMAHQNVAPFVSRHLIQQLVTSNPSPAYVQRVAGAWVAGQCRRAGPGGD